MLESLHLKNVESAPEMKLELAPRLNLIMCDNGLHWNTSASYASLRRHDLCPRSRVRTLSASNRSGRAIESVVGWVERLGYGACTRHSARP
jgi:hypothetical protein